MSDGGTLRVAGYEIGLTIGTGARLFFFLFLLVSRVAFR